METTYPKYYPRINWVEFITQILNRIHSPTLVIVNFGGVCEYFDNRTGALILDRLNSPEYGT